MSENTPAKTTREGYNSSCLGDRGRWCQVQGQVWLLARTTQQDYISIKNRYCKWAWIWFYKQ